MLNRSDAASGYAHKMQSHRRYRLFTMVDLHPHGVDLLGRELGLYLHGAKIRTLEPTRSARPAPRSSERPSRRTRRSRRPTSLTTRPAPPAEPLGWTEAGSRRWAGLVQETVQPVALPFAAKKGYVFSPIYPKSAANFCTSSTNVITFRVKKCGNFVLTLLSNL